MELNFGFAIRIEIAAIGIHLYTSQRAVQDVQVFFNPEITYTAKMPEYVPARGFKEMENLIKLYENQRSPIYIYFYGEKDKDGRSWCPDCVAGR